MYTGDFSMCEQTFTNFMVLWLLAKVFFTKFGDVTFFGAGKTSNPQKFSQRKSYFHKFTIVFSLESFPLILTYFPAISERNPLYGIIIHLSQKTNI